MGVELILMQIVAGTTTAPVGRVHVVAREVLVSAIEEIERLRIDLEKEKLANISKHGAVIAPMPGPL